MQSFLYCWLCFFMFSICISTVQSILPLTEMPVINNSTCSFQCKCQGKDASQPCGPFGLYCLPVRSELGCCFYWKDNAGKPHCATDAPPATSDFERNCLCKSGSKHACHLCNQPENRCSGCNSGFIYDSRYSVCCPNQTATTAAPTQPIQLSSTRAARGNVFWYVLAFGLCVISGVLFIGASLFCFRKRKSRFVHAQEYEEIATS